MKSFFEFYEKIRNNNLNEQDAMIPPNMGMGGGMGGMPGMGGGMGGMPGMGGGMPGGMPTSAPQMPMGGMDQNMQSFDTGMGEEGGSDDQDRNQTAPPAHEMSDDNFIPMLNSLIKYAKKMEVDEEKSDKHSEVLSQLRAAMQNFADMTGQAAPDEDGEDGDEDGGENLPDKNAMSAGADMIPPGGPTAYGDKFANPAGGDGNQFPSAGGGSGDLGYGTMAGGSSPSVTGPGMQGM